MSRSGSASPKPSCSASIFIATSRDGFIADSDGKVDWLNALQSSHPLDPNVDGDGGFSSFLSSVDALIMGRKTYETVLGFLNSGVSGWPYGDVPTFVLSSSPEKVDVPSGLQGKVSASKGDPREVLEVVTSRLVSMRANRDETGGGEGSEEVLDVYVDGGDTIQRFLNAGLVQRAILTVVPVELGEGIPLFKDPKQRHALKKAEERIYSNGFVQTTYRVES